MSSLSQRDRRELEALKRRVAHSQRQHAENLTRAFRRLPPELDAVAEQLLRLEPGAIAHWRTGDELTDAVERILEWLEGDMHERRNGSEE
jgi:hypothetical protein